MTLVAKPNCTSVGVPPDVLGKISRAVKDGTADPAVQFLFPDTHQTNKVERLRPLRRATKVLTQPARHRDEMAVAIEWSWIDASSSVSITTALLQEMSAPGAE